MSSQNIQDVGSWQWLYLPIFVTLLPFVARIIDPATDNVIFGEMGVMENLTVIFLLIGIVAGLRSFLGVKMLPVGWMRPWLVILILGSVFCRRGTKLGTALLWLGNT